MSFIAALCWTIACMIYASAKAGQSVGRGESPVGDVAFAAVSLVGMAIIVVKELS